MVGLVSSQTADLIGGNVDSAVELGGEGEAALVLDSVALGETIAELKQDVSELPQEAKDTIKEDIENVVAAAEEVKEDLVDVGIDDNALDTIQPSETTSDDSPLETDTGADDSALATDSGVDDTIIAQNEAEQQAAEKTMDNVEEALEKVESKAGVVATKANEIAEKAETLVENIDDLLDIPPEVEPSDQPETSDTKIPLRSTTQDDTRNPETEEVVPTEDGEDPTYAVVNKQNCKPVEGSDKLFCVEESEMDNAGMETTLIILFVVLLILVILICCYAGYNAFCKPAAEAPELEDSEQAKIPIGDENIYDDPMNQTSIKIPADPIVNEPLESYVAVQTENTPLLGSKPAAVEQKMKEEALPNTFVNASQYSRKSSQSSSSSSAKNGSDAQVPVHRPSDGHIVPAQIPVINATQPDLYDTNIASTSESEPPVASVRRTPSEDGRIKKGLDRLKGLKPIDEYAADVTIESLPLSERSEQPYNLDADRMTLTTIVPTTKHFGL